MSKKYYRHYTQMGNNFKTVQEVTRWRNFQANGQTYDLSFFQKKTHGYADGMNSG